MRSLKILALCVAAGVTVPMVTAQEKPDSPPKKDSAPGQPPRQRPDGAQPGGPGGPGAQMSPEKAKAAWEVEATGVAKRIGVADDKIKAVVTAYSDARTSQAAAMTKVREDMAKKAKKDDDANGGPRGMAAEIQAAMEDVNKAEREKLKTALTAAITADQTAKAMKSLGAFNRMWDGMANTIADFKLDAAKQQTALNAVEDFVLAQDKARTAGADGDREAMRTAMTESRKKLTDSLKPVLSEEQLKKFEESTRMGGGRGRGGPGGGGGGGGGNGGGGG